MEKNKSGGKPPKTKKTRGPKSGTSYPYYNLEDSVHLAQSVHERGGGTCSRDQLASFLRYSSTNSGAFLSRVSAAKQFGLIVSEGGRISVTERARNIFAPVIEQDTEKFKVEAFLSIDLFKTVFEQFNGQVLPSPDGMRNYFGNEFRIVKDRVKPALRVLMESAKYAGYFDTHGDQTRLIEPAIGIGSVQQNEATKSDKKEEARPEVIGKSKIGSESGGAPTGIHTAIIGLLRELPAPGPWKKSQKEGFMQAFKSIIDFIYPDNKENDS